MTDRLIKSAEAQGLHLLGLDGVKLGTVRELYVDLTTGNIEFVIVEAAGLLGGSGKFRPVPWTVIRYDPIAGGFQAALTKEAFKAAPDYDRDQLGKPGFAWSEQAERYFRDVGNAPH